MHSLRHGKCKARKCMQEKVKMTSWAWKFEPYGFCKSSLKPCKQFPELGVDLNQKSADYWWWDPFIRVKGKTKQIFQFCNRGHALICDTSTRKRIPSCPQRWRGSTLAVVLSLALWWRYMKNFYLNSLRRKRCKERMSITWLHHRI